MCTAVSCSCVYHNAVYTIIVECNLIMLDTNAMFYNYPNPNRYLYCNRIIFAKNTKYIIIINITATSVVIIIMIIIIIATTSDDVIKSLLLFYCNYYVYNHY